MLTLSEWKELDDLLERLCKKQDQSPENLNLVGNVYHLLEGQIQRQSDIISTARDMNSRVREAMTTRETLHRMLRRAVALLGTYKVGFDLDGVPTNLEFYTEDGVQKCRINDNIQYIADDRAPTPVWADS